MSNPSYTIRGGGSTRLTGSRCGILQCPAFVDVDDDGDMDLVIGSYEGDLKHYYENTGSASNPSYEREVASQPV